MQENNKVLLIILDGWGEAAAWGGNAVEMAKTLNMDNYWRKYPHTVLRAAEEAVGLPRHEPGNSEVGHLNLGSGQIVRQNLPGITQIIEDGTFYKNEVLSGAITSAKNNNSNIHIMGLLSDGGIHSHINHLFALMDMVKQNNFDRVFIHVFTDGRDTDQMKALSYIGQLEEKIRQLKIGKIQTISGRYYAMDRDNRWERISQAYDCIVSGIGVKSSTPEKAISESYRQGRYDEFIIPTAITDDNNPFVPINDKDSVIFFNFRADRTKELTMAFTDPNFGGFRRRKTLKDIYFATFAFQEEYGSKLPVRVIFRPGNALNPIAKVLSENNLKQLHIAETEKFAHVTYFFNGGKEKQFPAEDRILIPSPKVATYDLKPEMSAPQIAERLVDKFSGFNFTVVNFANPDMVGHTGNLKATVKACEVVDICLGKVVNEALRKKYVVVITADHGNAEQMINPNTGEPHTEHTISPVPFILVSDQPNLQSPLKDFGQENILACVSPTILKIMGLPIPKEMTGKSLVG